MHRDLEEAIDLLDCSVFSGDTFHDPETNKAFRKMLSRWQKEVNKYSDSEGETTYYITDRRIKLGDTVEVINDSAYHDKGDWEEVYTVNEIRVSILDNSGGVVNYRHSDLKIVDIDKYNEG